MEGELRCEGEERTAAACPATALPTEPPNPPHFAASCRRHQQRWRREKEANARREGSLCVVVVVLEGWLSEELLRRAHRRRLGRCRRKRACTRGCWSGSPLPEAPLHLWPPGSHIEVAVLLPLPLPRFLVNGYGAVVAGTNTGAAATSFPKVRVVEVAEKVIWS
ncbi:uncharacterized protein LOC107486653 [Arachis duranensis]|uniref:Uncharacterized protein LOC107486653 n=1 Tax=Arachis duranensis TaxID=130453 RepID=A0A6P4D5J3_ARADU|nr:uncharacterized protein LOC107486653 [Arachis duranensis]XP_052116858.1 uncharacterized protein LOC107486653 [Arachis duranensis]